MPVRRWSQLEPRPWQIPVFPNESRVSWHSVAEIIVALDVPTAADALSLVDSLPGLKWVKVGPTLFVTAGPGLIAELKKRGLSVFLDLKWHDIPHQVAGAVTAAAGLDVDLATVHTLGGIDMMRAARDAAGTMKLVGVTVLTSHSPSSFSQAVGRSEAKGIDLTREVARLATMAMDAGLHGIVASPLEITTVRNVVRRDAWIVVPGIRPAGTDQGDQQRTAEPREAASAGATHLVVGRPITQAGEPGVVYRQLCEAAA
jgi:orotidine-5'-phosphate decarboxylase